MSEQSQETKTGAHYIVNYYNEVEQLKASYVQYLNLLLELEAKHPGEDIKNVTDEERSVLNIALQNLRYYAIKAKLGFETIKSNAKKASFNDKDEKRLHELSSQFKKTYMVDRNDVEEYCLLMDNFLGKNIMPGLLRSSQDIISELTN